MGRVDGMNPDLRVSDADRDTVASELGQHFQEGLLDKAEFDERVTPAAKTERDVDEVLIDLPQAPAHEPRLAATERGQEGAPEVAPWRSASPRPMFGGLRILTLLPLLLAAVVISGLLSGGWHYGLLFAPLGFLWLIVPILACRTWSRGGRRRQWR